MALLLEHQFRQLPADRQVETRPFLEAAAYLPPLFDCFGSAVFAPMKADMSSNISKIKLVFDTNPGRFKTLQQILEAEKEMHGEQWPRVGATLALMWLKRFDNLVLMAECVHSISLRFIQVFLQSLANGEKDEANPNLIRVNLSKAYEVALKRYHGWLVQQLFKVSSGFRRPAADTELTPVFAPQAALFTAPYKSDFLRALSKGRDVKEEDCLEKIRKFLVNFTATVDVIYEMYGKMNPDLENRV
ncbi:unnamed protein product [Tetraodon nigroviridis]|uniref:(spotted green pufferfish) hypothetical protein n=1 Tax=Tetraodon nigroviridis TaxID=99883 RepID=Q4RSW0_TETNG|nr:unnamed protein product [Tetraodon nigroviridis]